MKGTFSYLGGTLVEPSGYVGEWGNRDGGHSVRAGALLSGDEAQRFHLQAHPFGSWLSAGELVHHRCAGLPAVSAGRPGDGGGRYRHGHYPSMSNLI